MSSNAVEGDQQNSCGDEQSFPAQAVETYYDCRPPACPPASALRIPAYQPGPISPPSTFKLGILAASIALGCIGPSRALADCTPATPADGDTVTCGAGFTSGGVNSSAADLTVNVESGAQLDGGVAVSGSGTTTVTNDGTIQGPGVSLANPDAASVKTMTNNGILNSGIVGSGDGTINIIQRGTLNTGGIVITGNGTNNVTLAAGHNTNGTVSLTGADNRLVSFGTFNSGLVMTATGTNTFINSGGTVNGNNVYSGPNNFIFNQGGIFNNGIALNSDGANAVFNETGGTINNSITSVGQSQDLVDSNANINGPVSLGPDNDTLINREQALIAASVDMGPGDDTILMLGGTIQGDIDTGTENDLYDWRGGQIQNFTMNDGDDHAIFTNLNPTFLLSGRRYDGGNQTDHLEWINTQGEDVDRYLNWELFQLTNGSQLTFAGSRTLTLGDATTGAGELSIDASSTVLAGDGTHTVAPAVSGQLVTVTNAGLIDLSNGNPTATDRFVVGGNYVGQGGQINLQTVLASDGSPSDQLVISGAGASGSGSTTLNISNLNGPGDYTLSDGIRVVDADGGATTTAGAFALGGTVAAGMFEYQLFRGGVVAGSEEDWFLRSAVPVSPPPVSPPPVSPPPVSPPPVSPPPVSPPPVSPPPVSPPPVSPPPVSPPPVVVSPPPVSPPPVSPPPSIPLVRPEVPGYTMAPALARQMDREVLGTFHERQGDQLLLTGEGRFPSGWARVFGDQYEQGSQQRISGTSFDIDGEFDGHIWGLQFGHDLFARSNDDGTRDRVGVMFSSNEAKGDIEGYTLGRANNDSGKLDLDSYSLGLYATRMGAHDEYLDAVLLVSWLDGKATSNRGIGADIDGRSYLASLEAGYPHPMNNGWTVEPQVQLIWQKGDLDDTHDRFSSIEYDSHSTYTGRIGVRAEKPSKVKDSVVKPYVDLNLWDNFSTSEKVSFNGRAVDVRYDGLVLEAGAGVAAQITQDFSLYGGVRAGKDLDDEHVRTLSGEIGMRILW